MPYFTEQHRSDSEAAFMALSFADISNQRQVLEAAVIHLPSGRLRNRTIEHLTQAVMIVEE
jgi:hypothetical protein